MKTGIVALIVAMGWGSLMAIFESLGKDASALFPVEHAHLAFVGWLVNTVIGFALWFLPLDRTRFPKTQGRYDLWMPWTIYALLNIGLVMRLISEPLVASFMLARTALFVSAVMQFAAALIFVALAWSRVRPPSRPAAGVR